MTELDELNFASNKLKTLPKVDQWKKLKRLAVFWNTLVMLPSFANLESLECLQLYDNQLENFPSMGNHPQLKEIDLNQNRVAALNVEDFSQMPALESLQLSKNKVEVLPGEILKGCSALSFLNFSDNPVQAMPEEIGGCSELEVLFWARTKTTALPVSFEPLAEKLLRVDLEGNELDESAAAMCEKMQSKIVNRDGFFKY